MMPSREQREYLSAIDYRLTHPGKRVRVIEQIVWDEHEINYYQTRVGKSTVHEAEWCCGFGNWLMSASIPQVEEAKMLLESGEAWSPPT